MGDSFNAADYTVTVTEVSPQTPNGGFTGRGYVSVLLPMGVTQNVAVTFDNISINDCYELVNGKIELVVDPNKQLLDVDDAWEGMQDLLAQTEARIETAQTSIDKILALNKNATANKQAILDELAKLKPTIDSLLADDCRTQAFKDSILREYNEMVAYAQSRNARLAATNADNPITKYLTSWAERLLTPVLKCVIDKSNFPQLINLIVQETEYKKSLLRVNSAGVTGDTKCNLLFVEGFVHQFFGNLDAIGLSEAIAKVGVDKLKGFLEYIKNCSNSSVTGQSYFENCLLNEPLLIKPTVDAFQMTKGLYDVVSTSVGEAYSCACWDQNGAAASVECAHIRGQITGFVASAVLEEILTASAASTWLAVKAASIAKKSIRKVEALVVNGKTILTKTNLKTADFRKWINNKSADLTEIVKKALGKRNGYYVDIDTFKDAVKNGEKVFYLGKHSDITPRPTGYQSHHGVNSVWMEKIYADYNPSQAPSIYMLNNPNHNATRGVFNRWRSEMLIKQGTTTVDYKIITEAEIRILAERQFDAAQVPMDLRKAESSPLKSWTQIRV